MLILVAYQAVNICFIFFKCFWNMVITKPQSVLNKIELNKKCHHDQTLNV